MAVLTAANTTRRSCRPRSRRGIWPLLALLVLVGWNWPAHAVSREYQLKAAFLFNFVQFVDWPAAAFTNASAPMCIGVLGEDPFDGVLDDTVRGETINGHPLVVRRYRQVADVQNCQLLFISHSEAGRLPDILTRLKGRSILTVGEAEGFCERGGIIRFVTEQNRIRFRINPEAARSANLTVSSKLLRLAEIVQPGGR